MQDAPPPPASKPRSPPLRQSAQQALLWSAGVNILRDILQFAQMLVLVRLLAPHDYGKVALATAILGFIGVASFQQFVAHVIQVRSDGAVNYDHHFSFGLTINSSLFLVTNTVALILSFLPEYAELQPLLHVMSFSFLLAVPGDLRVKMLERGHQWNRLRPLQIVSFAVGVACAMVLALAGAGVWALVLPGFVYNLVFAADLFLVAGWRPRVSLNLVEYRNSLYFGVNRSASNVTNGGRALLEGTLITQYFNFSTLGIFGRAEGLSSLFCVRVSQQIMSALYPVITRADPRSARFQRISGLVLSSVAWVVIPVAAFLAIEAPKVVELLYGSKWLEVVPLLPLAMVIGASRSIGSAAYQLLLANEQQRLCLRMDMVAFVMAAATMLTLIPFGVLYYLAGAVVVSAVVAGVILALLMRTEGLVGAELSMVLLPPIVATALAAVPVALLGWGLSDRVHKATEIAVLGAVFFAVYLFALRQFFRAPLTAIIGYVPGGARLGAILRL